MKKSELQKFAGVFFALVLGTATVFAQGWRNANRAYDNQNAVCLNSIPDLTEDQKAEIGKLTEKHFDEMAELRNQLWSTVDPDERLEIRAEMLKTVQAHQKNIKALLNPEQQKQYDAFRSQGNRSGGFQRGYGRGGANCQRAFRNQGNGYGYGPGFRGGNRFGGNRGGMGNFRQGTGRNGRGYGRCINPSNS